MTLHEASKTVVSSPTPASGPGDLISVDPFAAPGEIAADAHLLTHLMRGVDGTETPATTLLFVPRGAPPADGFPVVAWVHGTTTGTQPLRAPSLSETLDGGLTGDGYVSRWVWLISVLVKAGYAVVAPDLEGLGPAAEVPMPYFDASSLGRSQVAGLLAAHHAEPRLASRWASVGHSEGGHGSLVAEAYAEEAAGLRFVGAVAFAPLTSVAEIVRYHGRRAAAQPADAIESTVQQNFNVGLISTGLLALDPDLDLSAIMGDDLRDLMPIFAQEGSVGIVAAITAAVSEKTVGGFSGFRADWDEVPTVRAFLEANDPAAAPAFTVRRPTLILQGDQDISVPEPLNTAFARAATASGSSLDYRRYSGADHFTVLPESIDEALDFLAENLR